MSEKKRPFYQKIDGVTYAGHFAPEVVRRSITYKPKPKDFFVVTFPKCGTTWTQQIVYLIFNKGVPAKDMMEFMLRSPFLELTGTDAVEGMNGSGPLKVHHPYDLTPKSPEAKYLYVVRNPKDTLVSFYHHTATIYYDFEGGDFDEYFEIFLNGENDYGDYFDHVLGWYEHRNDPNVMFLTYEELELDTPKSVKKIAKFMGESYVKMLEDEPEIFANVLKYSSFEYMKVFNSFFGSFKNPEINMDDAPSGLKHLFKLVQVMAPTQEQEFKLVRKGIVGGWREVLSEDQNSRLDAKMEKKLKGTELYDFWKEIGCI